LAIVRRGISHYNIYQLPYQRTRGKVGEGLRSTTMGEGLLTERSTLGEGLQTEPS